MQQTSEVLRDIQANDITEIDGFENFNIEKSATPSGGEFNVLVKL